MHLMLLGAVAFAVLSLPPQPADDSPRAFEHMTCAEWVKLKPRPLTFEYGAAVMFARGYNQGWYTASISDHPELLFESDRPSVQTILSIVDGICSKAPTDTFEAATKQAVSLMGVGQMLSRQLAPKK